MDAINIYDDPNVVYDTNKTIYGTDAESDCKKAKQEFKGSSYQYLFTDYDIKINTEENNVHHITEDYRVCFLDNNISHGIYRKIPLLNNGRRADGSTFTTKARVSNLKVEGDQFTKLSFLNEYQIKIGNPSVTVSNTRHYAISYDYTLDGDKLKGADEFYFNLIGGGWNKDTIFLNTDYSITLPKDFDKNKIGFTYGEVGYSETANTNYSVENRTISGNFSEYLPGGNAFTIRTELPEGYFTTPPINISPLALLAIIPEILCLIIIAILYRLFGRNPKVTPQKVYELPKEYSPLDFALLTTRHQHSGVIALFFYLAEEGYIKLEENDEDITIYLIKDYDGENEDIAEFYKSLHSCTRQDKEGNRKVKLSKLRKKFYKYVDQIIDKSKYSKKNNYYDKSSLKARHLSFFLCAASISSLATIIIVRLFIIDGEPIAFCSASIASLILFPIAYTIFVLRTCQNIKKRRTVFTPGTLVLLSTFLIILAIASVFQTAFPALIYNEYDKIDIGIFLISETIILISFVLAFHIRRVSSENFKTRELIENYRSTIIDTNLLSGRGASYFYYNYAYAYAIGYNTKFSESFNNITTSPDWYVNNSYDFNMDSFTISSLDYELSSSFNHVTASSSSSSSSDFGDSSSSDSGGGGDSGGGSGGGGGGGW